jgi:hypothetical protein
MNKHQELMELAKLAIEEVFGDTSVSQQQTFDSLHELRDEIDIKIDCITHDLNEQET